MNANRHSETGSHSLGAPIDDLDPDSPEFIDACLDLIKRSSARRLQVAAKMTDGTGQSHAADAQALETLARAESGEIEFLRKQLNALMSERNAHLSSLQEARVDSSEIESLRQQLNAVQSERGGDISALREARGREAQVRTELQTMHTDLTNVRTRYNDAITALEAASQRASQSRDEYATAMAAIADRDKVIQQMRQAMADQDNEIGELQRRLIQAEEARISDASAILESLDQYRV